ncbi:MULTISPECIES: helix-turn-helix domain-containing protein [unclassified Bartonella]|uniref:helix-turn-helix domain-containing protein n=1 Tax=unclassified Bartonella TaxID=2645622 RepID=UPI0035CF8F2C
MSDEHDILTVEEVARYLKVTERHVYKLLSDRKIPAFKVGGAWRFKREQLEKWIEEGVNEQSKEKRTNKDD